MAETYTVTAPLVIVRNAEQGGRQEYLYSGAPLPSYVTKDERERLVDEGMVLKSGEAEEQGFTPANSPDQLNTEVLVPLPKAPVKATAPKPPAS